MEELLYLVQKLPPEAFVLDLGSGSGSFHYAACDCWVLAVELSLPARPPSKETSRAVFVQADSRSLPFPAQSVDAVICHHTLEHFADYKLTLLEIARVLKPQGWLWVSVPDGYGFDDALYRRLFSGGGHLNRFSREALVHEVQVATGFQLITSCALFSGFGYIQKPPPEKLKYYPRTARFIAEVPEGFLQAAIAAINAGTRIVDRICGSHCSQYGWAFIFAGQAVNDAHLPSFFNVCSRCGSGNSIEEARKHSVFSIRVVGFYRCPHCRYVNVFVAPPAGFL